MRSYLIAALPAQHFNAVDEIRIDRESFEAGIRQDSNGLSSKSIINLYVDPDSYDLDEVLETLYHELGHSISKSLRGTAHPGPKWKNNMDMDGNAISEYAAKKRYPDRNDQGEIEDFADAIRLYLQTDGATTGTLREACKNRLRILDELFEDNIHQRRAGTHRLLRRLLRHTTPLD